MENSHIHWQMDLVWLALSKVKRPDRDFRRLFWWSFLGIPKKVPSDPGREIFAFLVTLIPQAEWCVFLLSQKGRAFCTGSPVEKGSFW